MRSFLLLALCACAVVAQDAPTPIECGDCVVAHGSGGCMLPDVANEVCARDPYCCDVQWDLPCVNQARACENCLPFIVPNDALPEQCAPEVIYVHRHAERFVSSVSPRDDAQEVLDQEGVNRAMALAAKYVTERLPLQAIFVSDDYVRSPMTAAFLMAATGITSVTRFPATDFDALVQKIADLEPCPRQINIVTHGFFIRGVFQALGFPFDGNPNVGEFGQFFTLINNPDPALKEVVPSTYGILDTHDNQPWPGLIPFPPGAPTVPGLPRRHNVPKAYVPLQDGECFPLQYYVHRHAERYTSRLGNGIDDAQETLTLEGIQRSFDLRDKFIDEQLPLEAAFVSQQYIRSYQTAAPLIAETGITYVAKYNAQDPLNADLTFQLRHLNPCPAHVEIVTHGVFIAGIFGALGFDASQVDDIGEFGQFFILTEQGKTVVRDTYGRESVFGNQAWPGLVNFPSPATFGPQVKMFNMSALHERFLPKL